MLLPTTATRRPIATFTAALAIVSAACDPEQEGEFVDDFGLVDFSEDDFGLVEFSEEAGCLGPSSGDVVMSPRNVDGDSDIHQIEVSGDDLFFASHESIFRVPAAGGEPERLYRRPNYSFHYMRFHVRSNDLVALVNSETFVSIPRGGGEPTVLGEAPYRFSDAWFTPDVVFVGNKAYGRHDSRSRDGLKEVTFFEVDLDTLDARELYFGDIGRNAKFVVVDDFLYTSSRTLDAEGERYAESIFMPDLLYRIPLAGGEPELVMLDGEPLDSSLLGASAGQLVLAGSGPNPLFGGIYSLPVDGGTPSMVADAITTLFSLFEFAPTGEGYVVSDASYIHSISHDKAENLCLSDDYAWRGLAASDEHVWVSYFDDDDRSAILRVPLELATQ